MKENLFEYLKDIHSDLELDLIKYHLNSQINDYGDHFKSGEQKKSLKKKFFFLFRYFLTFIYLLVLGSRRNSEKSTNVLSAAYGKFDEKLIEYGFKVHRLPSAIRKGQICFGDFYIFYLTIKIDFALKFSGVNYLASKNFFDILSKYHCCVERQIKKLDYKFLFVPNDVVYFNKLFIKIFKDLNKKTFLVSHGAMPSVYDLDGGLDNLTDFAIMKSQMEVDSFVKMGYNPQKYLVSGHPDYNSNIRKFRFSFDSVLVITKSINGVSLLNKPIIEDRGQSITYLLSIQKVLLSLGIHKVKLRPHPSENFLWYKSHLDNNFFQISYNALSDDMNQSTLVIGPTSSVIVDALFHGVNYLIYEPLINGKLLTGYPVNPPLDGSDNRIPIARSENDLFYMLDKKMKICISVYDELAYQFNLDFLSKLEH